MVFLYAKDPRVEARLRVTMARRCAYLLSCGMTKGCISVSPKTTTRWCKPRPNCVWEVNSFDFYILYTSPLCSKIIPYSREKSRYLKVTLIHFRRFLSIMKLWNFIKYGSCLIKLWQIKSALKNWKLKYIVNLENIFFLN